MAIVSKKKAAPAATTNTAPTKKPTAPVKKTAEVKAEATPAVEKKTAAKGGKRLSLTGNTKTPKSFEIKEGTQATQEAFIDKFYKKMQELGYDVTKEQVKKIKTAYSETLREVTDLASYQDTDAGFFYARRYIETRVTQPPKAKNNLKTLMLGHYEIKVRKLIGDESEIKFFGEVSADGKNFIAHVFDEEGNDTGKTIQIPINEEEEVEVKPVKKVAAKKPAPVVVEEEDEEEEVEEIDEDDEFDDFLDDDED